MTENVFADQEWHNYGEIPSGWCTRARPLVRGTGGRLNMSLYELHPGETSLPYHFHHGAEELLIVLLGTPTLRTPDGERQLEQGESVHFPNGPAGAHQLINRSDCPSRYVVAAVSTSPELVEYPDSGRMLAAAGTEDARIWTIHRRENEVGYWDGESPRTAI